MEKTYRSGISTGLIIFLVLVFGIAGVPIFMEELSLYTFIALLLPVVFTWYVLAAIKYKIHDNELTVSGGFLINGTIDIEDIKQIKKTRSLISSPAASFDRIQIFYGGNDSVIISPKEKKEFIDHLLSINPDIVIDPAITF